jgi:hypothetical protein
LEFGSRSRVSRCLEFGSRSRVSRCLEFGTGSQSGRSREKRASLPEQQRLASGNVSGKLIGASGTNPPSAPKRGKKWPGSGTHESGISPSKGGRFLACELRPIAPPQPGANILQHFRGACRLAGSTLIYQSKESDGNYVRCSTDGRWHPKGKHMTKAGPPFRTLGYRDFLPTNNHWRLYFW